MESIKLVGAMLVCICVFLKACSYDLTTTKSCRPYMPICEMCSPTKKPLQWHMFGSRSYNRNSGRAKTLASLGCRQQTKKLPILWLAGM